METKKDMNIECENDQELLEFLLTYLTESADNQLILNEYPDGQPLTEDQISFNTHLAISGGMVPIMAFRTSENYYTCFSAVTSLTAIIPVDIVDH